MAKRPTTIADIEKKIARWQTRFRRAMNAISKLSAQHKRMVKAAQQAAQPPVTMIAVARPMVELTPSSIKKIVAPPPVVTPTGAIKISRVPTPKATVPGVVDLAAENATALAKAKALREEMQRKKPVRTKRAPLSTPPATA